MICRRRLKELKGLTVQYRKDTNGILSSFTDTEAHIICKDGDLISVPLQNLKDISLEGIKAKKRNVVRELCYSNRNELIAEINSAETEFDILKIMHKGEWY